MNRKHFGLGLIAIVILMIVAIAADFVDMDEDLFFVAVLSLTFFAVTLIFNRRAPREQ